MRKSRVFIDKGKMQMGTLLQHTTEVNIKLLGFLEGHFSSRFDVCSKIFWETCSPTFITITGGLNQCLTKVLSCIEDNQSLYIVPLYTIKLYTRAA